MNLTTPLHHAYAIQGDKERIVPELIKFLEKNCAVSPKNNPDFSYQQFETFTIDDGRDLQDRHGRRAISGNKIFIIATRFITSEAQNALLKLFEEPSPYTHLFLIMPNTQTLLPTLRSRLLMIKEEKAEQQNSELKALAQKFIKEKPAKRIALIKDLIEEKDKGKAIDFVSEMEKVLAEKLPKNTSEAKNLKEILLVKKYLHDRAPSIKLLLEHLSITI